jgi:hypothetical protein
VPNMNKPPLVRGSWVLKWDSDTIINQSFAGRGWWMDVGKMTTALDVLNVLRKAKEQHFTTAGDIASLADLLRIFVLERHR